MGCHSGGSQRSPQPPKMSRSAQFQWLWGGRIIAGGGSSQHNCQKQLQMVNFGRLWQLDVAIVFSWCLANLTQCYVSVPLERTRAISHTVQPNL